jgi:hypothetical protein
LPILPNDGQEVSMTIPTGFDLSFLNWFRSATEATWATYQPRTLEYYVAHRAGGADWQTGTRWLGGLSDAEIAAAEARWAIQFPPDYRLFLATLHTVDRPMLATFYVDSTRMALRERISFYDWRPGQEGDGEQYTGVAGAFAWPYEGLFFDLQHGFWPPTWGPMPPTLDGRAAHLRGLLAAAPPLVPIDGHRYLLATPHRAGNPVLSVYQSDTIVYATSFRSYLLTDHLALAVGDREERRRVRQELDAEWAARDREPIPFWGELYRHRRDPTCWPERPASIGGAPEGRPLM